MYVCMYVCMFLIQNKALQMSENAALDGGVV
jgi:hypothetical protein